MITKQEAVKELQAQIETWETMIANIKHDDPEENVSNLEMKIQTAILAKLALEREIPRKANGDKECYACPTCGYDFPDIGGVNESYGESETYSHCPECGQKISYGSEC